MPKNNDIMTSLLPSIKNGEPRKVICLQITAPEDTMLSAVDSISSQFENFGIANVMLSNATVQIGTATYATISVTVQIDLGAG